MGWIRLVGSLTIRVSFAKDPYKRDLYFAKETYIFKEPTNRSHPIGADSAEPTNKVLRGGGIRVGPDGASRLR